MKSLKIFFLAMIATTALVSCTDDRKTAVYEAESQADKIETALSEACLLLNPNFYYESVEAVAWLMNYCTHEHVADMTDVEKYFAGVMESWTESSESESAKVINALYQLSDVKGHFKFEQNEASGKAEWTRDESDDLLVTWPSKDGLTCKLSIIVKDSSSKFLMESYSTSEGGKEISASEYLILPKHIAFKLVKGGRTISNGSLYASYKIASSDKISIGDRLNFSLNLDVEDYNVTISKSMASTSEAKASIKATRKNDLIIKGTATLDDIKFNDNNEKKAAEFESAGKLSFSADLLGEVQVIGTINVNSYMQASAAESEAVTKEDLERIAVAYNKATDVTFYFDGFKTPQSHIVYLVDPYYYDEIDYELQTLDGKTIEITGARFDTCYLSMFTAFSSIGYYYCPECNEYEYD